MKTKIFKQAARTITGIIAVAILLSTPQLLKAQGNYKLVAAKDVAVKVLGSSNVHDWVMTATGLESQGDFKFDAQNELTGLTTLNFSVDVKSLKSEHASMDDRTYKTISADKYPKVVYKLTSATVTTTAKGKYLIKTKGELTIADVTQPISMDVTAVLNADNSISCTGSEKLKLTDYKIDPPSFLLGAMKVTNDLTIQFNLLFKK